MQCKDACGSFKWTTYYEHHRDRPASSLLHTAIGLASTQTNSRKAVDLGCGSGNETRALLQAGWDVLAIDREPAAIEMVHAIGLDHPAAKLETATQWFESIEALPPSSLIHAGMALPFCHPDHFEKFWSVVTSALLPGGVFVGQLFGDKDDWASDPERTFHSESEARVLFQDLSLKAFKIHEYDGLSMRGTKHWHRFDVIAQKPASNE
ncbi:methyltransferase domain-containing protein [Pseudomonas putida]|uniref:class I SAM-dependent methyltransferase n=1 Tax=Pseudomonas putida TaxID=303 RepID=UPI00159DD227|nr:methyltransferase domain-containing protein [Pseudomonas putida]NVN62648.1 methyltransferase domain-containing protein [Pseudomonas putida]NVN67722.1 methyltransferase domain-containing protein [Pseudomonas putida]